ncbi:MAG TPA: peptide deformylase [Stellaceae bacterium]|nr:peptide deformylase [Stellaceae bacterium]
MSILKLARMGHPVLRIPARPVEDPTAPEIRALVGDMIETMADAGGVGLAAPQVHASLRVLIYCVPAARVSGAADDVPVDLTAIVNPLVEPDGDEQELGWEGCLSIPGLRGAVPRYTRVRYAGFDLDGERIEAVATGFHARVLQHEADHLDGIMYPERMTDLRLLSFIEESARFPVDLAAYAAEGRP